MLFKRLHNFYDMKIMNYFDLAIFIESMKNPKTLAFSFWVSVILLIIISLFKYLISKECVRKDWGDMLLEFPIDVCLIIITVVITGYMKGDTFASGVVLVLISIIISLFCCLFRRISIKHSYNENNKWKSIMWGFLDIFLAIFWISTVYYNIIII